MVCVGDLVQLDRVETDDRVSGGGSEREGRAEYCGGVVDKKMWGKG